jgi:hypothetical protein
MMNSEDWKGRAVILPKVLSQENIYLPGLNEEEN